MAVLQVEAANLRVARSLRRATSAGRRSMALVIGDHHHGLTVVGNETALRSAVRTVATAMQEQVELPPLMMGNPLHPDPAMAATQDPVTMPPVAISCEAIYTSAEFWRRLCGWTMSVNGQEHLYLHDVRAGNDDNLMLHFQSRGGDNVVFCHVDVASIHIY